MIKAMKKVLFGALCVSTVLASTSVVFAASGQYDSTYSMTGGLYTTQTWDPTGPADWEVIMDPTQGNAGSSIIIYLERDAGAIWAIEDQATVSSTAYSSTNLTSSTADEYRFYFRNRSGLLFEGDVTIKYVW